MQYLRAIIFHIIIFYYFNAFGVLIPPAKPFIMVPPLKPEITIPEEISTVENQWDPVKEQLVTDPEFTLDFSNDDIQIAAFERNGWYWFAINQISDSDLDKILSENLHHRYDIVKNDQQLVFRIKADLPYIPFIEKKDGHIIIKFLDIESYDKPLQKLVPQIGDAKITLTMFSNVNKYIEVIDPDIKDKLVIVLADVDHKNIDREYHFIYFNLLRSYYGAAFVARSDHLQTTLHKGVLQVSYPQNNWQDFSLKTNSHDLLFQFNDWYEEDFNAVLIQLQQKILEEASLEARLNLVKFFLGQKMIPEALSYLNYIGELYEDYHDDYHFKLLNIATLYLLQKYSAAYREVENFPVHSLSHQQKKEFDFWKDAIVIQLTDAKISLHLNNKFLDQYSYYETDFLLLALKQAIIKEDYTQIKDIEDNLDHKVLSPYQRNQFLLLVAQIMMQMHEYNEALTIYDNLIADNNNIYHKALATVKKTEYLHQNSLIDLHNSIQDLEKLKPLIKGEKIEAPLLELLSTLYLDDKQYYNSIFLLKEIYTRFDSYYNAIQINQKIHMVLTHLFNERIIDSMSPLMAIDIFINFKEFLPIGDEGLNISLHFTDYLIKVNLISEAISFLQHLIQYRLQGEIKEESIIKLAKLYLDDNQPEQAIFLLNKYNVNNKQATYLHSGAFLQLAKYRLSYSLLAGDKSKEADNLRFKILWYEKNWDEIIEQLAPRLRYRHDPQQNLTEDEQQHLFYLAVAYFQKDDRENLAKLYEAFQTMPIKKQHTIKLLYKISHESISMRSFNQLLSLAAHQVFK